MTVSTPSKILSPFNVVCGASGFAIGYALMQYGKNNKERVICYQSCQLKPAKRN